METAAPFAVECMHCRRQRVDGVWVARPANGHPVGTKVSHGLCDECDETYYSDAAIEAALKKENDDVR